MTLRLLYSAATGNFEEAIVNIQKPIAKAATAAIIETRDNVRKEFKSVIAGGGFSARWQNIVRSKITPSKGESINASVEFFDKSFFLKLFGQGGTHTGRPLMWLPLPSVPFSKGKTRLTPKQYAARIGPLTLIRPPGHSPLLVGKGSRATITRATDKAVSVRKKAVRGGILRGEKVPLFVGVSSVAIGKKFDVRGIVDRGAERLPQLYYKHLKTDGPA